MTVTLSEVEVCNLIRIKAFDGVSPAVWFVLRLRSGRRNLFTTAGFALTQLTLSATASVHKKTSDPIGMDGGSTI
jgi:hypothetical protein